MLHHHDLSPLLLTVTQQGKRFLNCAVCACVFVFMGVCCGVLSCHQPAQALHQAPKHCWYCEACKFHGNTIGFDMKCQICNTKAKSDDDDGFGTWQCAEEMCMYETTGEVATCDACKRPRRKK